jgi:UDP-glucose 4-epimerase
MKIAVTGGAGFIGSHAVSILSENHEVIVIDNLRTGKLSNLKGLKCTFINCSIEEDFQILARHISGCGALVHLAAMVTVPESMSSPIECINLNTMGTANVLEACRIAGVKNVVFASSAAVYGDNPCLPLKEDFLPAPLSPYAMSKIDGEYLLDIYSKAHGFKTCAFRFFNVYGPRQDPFSMYSGVISKFMDAAVKNENLRIFGDGCQIRDFVYVKDLVLLIREAIEKNITGLYNLATNRPVSINDLARTVIDIFKAKSSLSSNGSFNCAIEYYDPRPGDIYKSLASIDRLKENFDNIPLTTLLTGLDECCSWFQAEQDLNANKIK